MKKAFILTLTLGIIMLLQICSSAVEVTVPKAAVPPAIDGAIGENEWYGAGKFYSDNKQAAKNYFTTAPEAEGSSVNISYLYDDNGLYLLVEAIDGTKGYGLEAGAAMITDGVQIVIDPTYIRNVGITDIYIFDFVPYTGADLKGEPCWFEHYQYNAYKADLGIKMKSKIDSVGYKIEIFLPWSALKFKNEKFEIKSGTKMGIGNCLMDFNDSTINFINYDYTSSDGAISADNLNTIILGDPVILPVAEESINEETQAENPEDNPITSDFNLFIYLFISALSICGFTVLKAKTK